MKSVAEIAKIYDVSTVTVRNWINDGLPYEIEKVKGIKTRMVINPSDVELYHKRKLTEVRQRKEVR